MERLYFSFLEKFSLFRRKGEKTGTRNGEKKECEEREQRSSSADKNQAREGKEGRKIENQEIVI